MFFEGTLEHFILSIMNSSFACGTGRIYLELLKDVDAYGIDISKNMLEVLKKKAKELKLKPKVYKADMRTFKLSHKFSDNHSVQVFSA